MSLPTISAFEAAQLAAEHYGLQVEAHPLPGERDANFRLTAADGRAWVLKIAPPDAPRARLTAQMAALDHLAGRLSDLPLIFAQFGSPARAPKRRGKSPGWPKGRRRTPKRRFEVLKKQPAPA